jgi:hypothetical protein
LGRGGGGDNDGTLYHDDRATTSTPKVNALNNLLQEHLTEQQTFCTFVIDAANKTAPQGGCNGDEGKEMQC